MLRRLDFRAALPATGLASVLPRAALDVEAAVEIVRPVVEDVRVRGGAAVRDATARFDPAVPESLRVPAAALAAALDALDPAVRAALEEAARRARVVHAAQRRADGRPRTGRGPRPERELPDVIDWRTCSPGSPTAAPV